MPPQNLPLQIVQDLIPCMGLGLLVGLVRICLPYRWRATAVCADFICTGLCMLLLQSYAAGYSQAGVFRWYMLACAGLGVWAVEQLLGGVQQKVERGIHAVLHKRQKKYSRRTKKRPPHRKTTEKQLQTNGVLLYNSNM